MVSKGRRGKREVRRTKPTVLFVGEGKTEVALIKHLKSLYQPERNPPVRIDTADGKDSGRILRTAIKRSQMEARDAIVCLYDLDKALPANDYAHVKSKRLFKLLGSNPCIEGFMLEILEKPVPLGSSDCKHKICPWLCGKETDASSYKVFTKELLENRRQTLPHLDKILTLIETGKGKNNRS